MRTGYIFMDKCGKYITDPVYLNMDSEINNAYIFKTIEADNCINQDDMQLFIPLPVNISININIESIKNQNLTNGLVWYKLSGIK